MKVAIVFEAPDELAGANLSKEDILGMFKDRIPGTPITAICFQEQDTNLPDAPISVEILEKLKHFELSLEDQAVAVKDLQMEVDDYERKIARDRRQQHKLAVKFSNRRK